MASVLQNIIKSRLNVGIVVQNVRFYSRWIHRRPVNVYLPEEYENTEKKIIAGGAPQKMRTDRRSVNAYLPEEYENNEKNVAREAPQKKRTHRRPVNAYLPEEYENFEKNVAREAPQKKRTHRRPVNAYLPEEYENIEKNVAGEAPQKKRFDKSDEFKGPMIDTNEVEEPIKHKIKAKKEKTPLIATNQKSKVMYSSTDMLETVIDEQGNFIYTKMKNNDQRVGKILTEIKSKKIKEKRDVVLLEGKRIIKDALLSSCQLKYILFSRMDEINYLKPFLPKMGAHLYKMPYKEMQMWSDLTTTPGVMGIFKTPNVEDFNPKNPLPVTIIFDNIREPGNLGTMLRVCAAVGCQRVVLTKGCVNLWDSKVLRSSAGAHFKLRINTDVNWVEIEKFVDEGSVFIADNKIISDSRENPDELEYILSRVPLLPYYGVDFRNYEHLVLIVGGETLGVSKDSYEFAIRRNGVRVNVPLSNDVDSLNVGAALGIISFEIKKQLTHIVNK